MFILLHDFYDQTPIIIRKDRILKICESDKSIDAREIYFIDNYSYLLVIESMDDLIDKLIG